MVLHGNALLNNQGLELTFRGKHLKGFLFEKIIFKKILFIKKKKDFIYLFMRDRETEREAGRGRSRLHAGNLTWDLIPGPQGPNLG